MKKLILALTLLTLTSVMSAKQYIQSGSFTFFAHDKVVELCAILIGRGYHIDSLTLDERTGRYVIIYSDKED